MLEEGIAYRCTCSKERLAEVREAAQAKGEKPKYDNCRDLNLAQTAATTWFASRRRSTARRW